VEPHWSAQKCEKNMKDYMKKYENNMQLPRGMQKYMKKCENQSPSDGRKV
jgi:hypothetical protein